LNNQARGALTGPRPNHNILCGCASLQQFNVWAQETEVACRRNF
jgi:hypothetical protein